MERASRTAWLATLGTKTLALACPTLAIQSAPKDLSVKPASMSTARPLASHQHHHHQNQHVRISKFVSTSCLRAWIVWIWGVFSESITAVARPAIHLKYHIAMITIHPSKHQELEINVVGCN